MLQKTSVSDIAEEYLITKMKFELGSQYITKYVQMGIDIKASKDQTEEFHKQMHGGVIKGVNLSIRVLTSGLWECEQIPNAILSPELFSCSEAFESFYRRIHSGRHLIWSGTLGDCEVLTHGFEKEYLLILTAYQTTILSLYNSKDMYTFKDLMNQIKLPPNVLSRQLFNLANPKMGKLLIKENIKTPNFSDNEKIKLNKNFSSVNLKTSLMPSMAKKKLTNERNQKYDEEVKVITKQRETVLQATIVKIMKRRKEQRHNDLIIEVIKMIQAFKPDPIMIKQQIEWLIEREYLIRDEKDK